MAKFSSQLKRFEPFQVITSDISYVRTSEDYEYLCKVRDAFSGIVLAHSMAGKQKC